MFTISPDLHSYHSYMCISSGFSECIWFDIFLYESLFFLVFTYGDRLIHVIKFINIYKLYPYDQFNVVSRLPLLLYNSIVWYYLYCWYVVNGMPSFDNWVNYSTILQYIGPLALGYYIFEIILIVYCHYTFTNPIYQRYLLNLKNKKEVEKVDYKLEKANFYSTHTGLSELQDTVPYLINIIIVSMTLEYQEMGLYSIILIVSSSLQSVSAFASLLASRYYSYNPLKRLNPYLALASNSPTLTIKLLRVFSDLILNGIKFLSGPYGLLNLYKARNEIDPYLCLFLIFAAIRETTAYLLLVGSIFSTFVTDR